MWKWEFANPWQNHWKRKKTKHNWISAPKCFPREHPSRTFSQPLSALWEPLSGPPKCVLWAIRPLLGAWASCLQLARPRPETRPFQNLPSGIEGPAYSGCGQRFRGEEGSSSVAWTVDTGNEHTLLAVRKLGYSGLLCKKFLELLSL